MARRCCLYGVSALLACALLSPSEAKAGIVLVTWGDRISHLGDPLPQNGANLGGARVGYKYSYFGVFWISLWTHSGEYCLYRGDRYQPIPRAVAAQLLGKSESDIGPPFLYRVPLGWLILAPVIAVGVAVSILKKEKKTGVAELFQDPRYQKALEILQEQYAKQTTAVAAGPGPEPGLPEKDGAQERFHAAFEAGVQHLVSLGVPREEAEGNLGVMVQMALQRNARKRQARKDGQLPSFTKFPLSGIALQSRFKF